MRMEYLLTNSPVQLGQRIVQAQFLMKLGELLVRTKQMGRIGLTLTRHLQNERVVLFEIVALLESMDRHRFQASVLTHSTNTLCKYFIYEYQHIR